MMFARRILHAIRDAFAPDPHDPAKGPMQYAVLPNGETQTLNPHTGEPTTTPPGPYCTPRDFYLSGPGVGARGNLVAHHHDVDGRLRAFQGARCPEAPVVAPVEPASVLEDDLIDAREMLGGGE